MCLRTKEGIWKEDKEGFRKLIIHSIVQKIFPQVHQYVSKVVDYVLETQRRDVAVAFIV